MSCKELHDRTRTLVHREKRVGVSVGEIPRIARERSVLINVLTSKKMDSWRSRFMKMCM